MDSLDDVIEELRALDREATPPPWTWAGPPGGMAPWLATGTNDTWHEVTAADLDLVVAMRNALPALLARLKKLQSRTCWRCHGRGKLDQYGGPGADYDETADVPCPECRAHRERLGYQWVQAGRRGGWQVPDGQ